MRPLSYKEEELMNILWRLEKALVWDIIAEMDDPKPPYNTVSSLVRKLDKEGIIGHESFGKTHRYYPVLKKRDYRKSSFRKFMNHYFSGSAEELLSFFVEEEDLSPEELDALLAKVKKKADE
ncbi:MAG: BlaI/MecI/CopY family transcriptional regulator [Saprospiraceae bacterium]|nr:BlaI/MecI/CopY family transcriptional regulator [Saprospiraceae bacterium]